MTEVRAVDRAIAILECFQPGERGLTLTEIANRTNLSKATAIRLLATLERRSMVLRGAGLYGLGPALLRLGNAFREAVDIAPVIVPALETLVQRTGESASFFVREGTFRRCLLRVECSRTLRDHVRIGDLVPLPAGAFGRVIAAFAEEGARPDDTVAPFVTRGERVAEMASVAMPIWGPDVIFQGAIGVAIPLFRLSDDGLETCIRAVREAACTVTHQLGGESRGMAA